MFNEIVFGIAGTMFLMILYGLNSKIDEIDKVVESMHNDNTTKLKLQKVELKIEHAKGYLEGHKDGYQKGLEDRSCVKCNKQSKKNNQSNT